MICHPSNFQIRQEGGWGGGRVRQSLNAKNKTVFFPVRTSWAWTCKFVITPDQLGISISAWHQSNQLSSTKYIKLNVRKFWVLAEHGRVLHRPSNFQISLVHYKDTLFLHCFCNFFFVVMQSSIYCAISINLAGLVTHYTPAKILISAPCKNRVFHGYTSGRTFHNRTRNCGNRNRHGFG